MALTLTAREHEILAIVIREMKDIPAVDFNVIAPLIGQKYARNARSAFKKIWEKLKSGNGDEIIKTAASDEEDIEVDAPKLKAKVTQKKSIGQRKAPPKVAGAGRSRGPSKKGREAKIRAEAVIKTEAESGNDADGEGDTTGVIAGNIGMGGDSETDHDGYTGRAGSPEYQENEEKDEQGAAMLGITIEEFRALANRANYGNGRAAPTTPPYVESENES